MPLAPWRLRFYFRKWRTALYDQATSQEFADAITDDKPDKVKNMLKKSPDPEKPNRIKIKIDPSYQDKDGNSYLHLAVMKHKWVYVSPVYYELGCPNNLVNKEGKLPFDLTNFFKGVLRNFGYKPVAKDSAEDRLARRDALVEEMQKYYREDMGGGVYPGRRLVKNLNLTFDCDEGKCDVPDSWEALDVIDGRRLTLHQRLAIAQRVSSSRALKIETMEPDKTSNCYVTAALTFVITAKKYVSGKKNKLKVVTVPVNVPGYLVYSDGATYAHAEEELFAYLNQKATTDALVAELIKNSGAKAEYKCFAVVFDIHTTYNMCGTCEGKTYGVESSHEGGLVQKLEASLAKVGILLPTEIQTADLLRPKKMQLTVSTRVSCHATYPHKAPVDLRGHTYPTYSGASAAERNIAKHRNAVVFHSRHEKSSDLEPYRFSAKKRREYVPCFVPNQTAFVMKSNSSRSHSERRKLQRPVKIDKALMQKGMVIHSDRSMRCSSYKASKSMLIGFVRSGDIGVVKRLIGGRLSNIGGLRKLMLAVQRGQNIYHAAAESGDMDMLELVDDNMKRYFSEEREEMLRSVSNSPLGAARNIEVFYKLIEWGAQDPSGEHGAVFYDELSSESEKLDFIAFYRERKWDDSFSEHDMTYGFGY